MARQGSLDYERFELIEGALIPKVSKNFPHLRALSWLVECLRAVFPGRLIVLQEAPIDVRPEDNPTSDPEPDVIVLARSLDDLGRRPRPEDILLLVEISDTTLAFDLSVKAKLYARAGIADYRVVDLNGKRIVVHRDPVAGSYRSVTAYSADQSVAPLAAPHAEIPVGEIAR
jgi:Uma2 family endonuclease